MDSVVQALLQLGIAGVMAAAVVVVLWYVLTKMIPTMLNRFSEEIRLEREACERRHSENIARHELTRKMVEDTRDYLCDGLTANRQAIDTLAQAARLADMAAQIGPKKKP